MLEKDKMKAFIEGQLENTDCYLTDFSVSGDNEVIVEIDSDTAVDIDYCIELSRAIEEAFPSEVEDYSLEVGSAGLTSPLRLPRQYAKHIGDDLEVLADDGKKYVGTLVAADAELEGGFTLKWEQKVKHPGEKRPVIETVERKFPYLTTRRAVYDLKF